MICKTLTFLALKPSIVQTHPTGHDFVLHSYLMVLGNSSDTSASPLSGNSSASHSASPASGHKSRQKKKGKNANWLGTVYNILISKMYTRPFKLTTKVKVHGKSWSKIDCF